MNFGLRLKINQHRVTHLRPITLRCTTSCKRQQWSMLGFGPLSRSHRVRSFCVAVAENAISMANSLPADLQLFAFPSEEENNKTKNY